MNRFQYKLYFIFAIIALNGAFFLLAQSSMTRAFQSKNALLFDSRFKSQDLVDFAWVSPSQKLSNTIDSLYSLSLEKRAEFVPLYQDIFREADKVFGFDWRLLAAIAYVESAFDSKAISRGGARGLMQIMPSTADYFMVDKENLFDPKINIFLAAQYLQNIKEMLRLSPKIDEKERVAIFLACYHGGIGRFFDVQRLAWTDEKNTCKWEDFVPYYLLLNDKKGYLRPEVQHGRYRGGQRTLDYVDKVFSRYNSNCLVFTRE